MKRFGVIASLVFLTSAILVTGAYAAAPDTVTALFAGFCEACDWCHMFD